MTQFSVETTSLEIQDCMAEIEKHTRACFALVPHAKPSEYALQAVYRFGKVDLPYNLKLFQSGLSNHAALECKSHLDKLDASIKQLSHIIHDRFKASGVDYVPEIILEWEIKKKSAFFKIFIDDIALSGRPAPVARFTDLLANGLIRHAGLPLKGPCQTYRVTNLPTHGRGYVDIKAPSEGLAIARIGALLGLNLTMLYEARKGMVSVVRKDAEEDMKNEARKALESIGLKEQYA
jgi:hypothetical protein